MLCKEVLLDMKIKLDGKDAEISFGSVLKMKITAELFLTLCLVGFGLLMFFLGVLAGTY
jgi:hypothetical protein